MRCWLFCCSGFGLKGNILRRCTGEVKFDIPLWNTVVQRQVQQVQDMSRRERVTVNLLWVTAGAAGMGCGVWDLLFCSAEEINSLADTKAVFIHVCCGD